MKRFFHLLIIFFILLSVTQLYATDLDDLLRGLDSPEVDYHVDEEIKTIIIPPKPVVKVPEKSTTADSETKNKVEKDSKDSEKATENKSKDSANSKNSEDKSKLAASSTVKLKSSLSDIAQKLKKDKDTNKKKSEKPIKIYSLFQFFKNMEFVKKWQDNIINNLAFCSILTEDVFDYWQQKSEEDEENEEEEEDDDNEGDGEEEEDEEEEAPIDFSKFAEQLAQAKTFCDEGKWDEVSKIFEEFPDASGAPEAQKYLLLVELNNPNQNINRLRSLGSSVLETDPNDPDANYALAIFHFRTKKKDVKKASQHIAIALKAKNPPKGALELSKEINSSGFAIYLIIGLLIIAIAGAVIFVLKKKKAKADTTGEATTPTEGEGATNQEGSKLAEKLAPIKAKLEPVLTKLQPILDKLKPVLQKIKPLLEKAKEAILAFVSKIRKKKQAEIDLSGLPANNVPQKEEEVEEIIVEVDEDGNEIMIEEIEDDGSGNDVTEEIIEEEIIEGADSSASQEIVEEHIIEEVEEDSPEEEIVEEIVEEEGEEEGEVEDKGTSEITEESILKE